MQTTHFRYKFYLHRAKIIALLLFLVSFQAFTQQRRKPGVTLHRIESDQKKFKYGFFLGAHQNYYGLQYSDAFSGADYDNVTSITPRKNLGFNLGFMVNFRLNDQFSFRFVPVKIGLYQHTVDYNFTDGTIDQQIIESTRIEPGLFLKYRSIRRDNSRMYLIAGVSASMRSGKDDLETSQDRLEIGKFNAKFEVGIGMERYFEFFKFAPEIRYSRGLVNVMTGANNFYHNGIQRLVTHNFSIYLHFSD
ncbi:putative protein-translocating porin PorT [Roseivirga pacifica]|uniref:Probable protein-translocating porin PorT n=1 Tax=Roseivirga pacifica TaxID=1267423 RepID=A0A1I0RJD3_9BACT|nr:outer membrane beta-barrel protein [Roseivirga pacifica]MCO6357818.1 outer membrane beta-barrel protein [Roseivirga pacifica]MCO6366070.1 outer membrane beta-barrel protein [Roseivirga pacifica]MCO6371398.1 outer membrane beta-barrel protein [Roseivirga pacifica]MCO6375430.1 outer membrane beta-barrel protein [Roseivirga pacifica]MCO6378776.1 outer membrane beta-barrel protein [Roseivirga pacifica]